MWDKKEECGLYCSYNATDLSIPLCVFATTYTRDGMYQGHSFVNDIKQIAMYSIFDADSLYYLGGINYIEDLYSNALHYRIATRRDAIYSLSKSTTTCVWRPCGDLMDLNDLCGLYCMVGNCNLISTFWHFATV